MTTLSSIKQTAILSLLSIAILLQAMAPLPSGIVFPNSILVFYLPS
jgi:hypothetical protein